MTSRIITFIVSAVFSTGTLAADSCLLPGASTLPANTTWNVGPMLYSIAASNSTVASLIFAGQDAWDGTDAVNRLAGWSGSVSASDCPSGLGRQLGAFGFAGSTCASTLAYSSPFGSLVGYVDYDPGACASCGTWSMVINLDILWSVDGTPAVGETDLGWTLAHEFGHMLGTAHHNYYVCQTNNPNDYDLYSFDCSSDPATATMQPEIRKGPGNTCGRTIELEDAYYVNQFYP